MLATPAPGVKFRFQIEDILFQTIGLHWCGMESRSFESLVRRIMSSWFDEVMTLRKEQEMGGECLWAVTLCHVGDSGRTCDMLFVLR